MKQKNFHSLQRLWKKGCTEPNASQTRPGSWGWGRSAWKRRTNPLSWSWRALSWKQFWGERCTLFWRIYIGWRWRGWGVKWASSGVAPQPVRQYLVLWIAGGPQCGKVMGKQGERQLAFSLGIMELGTEKLTQFLHTLRNVSSVFLCSC